MTTSEDEARDYGDCSTTEEAQRAICETDVEAANVENNSLRSSSANSFSEDMILQQDNALDPNQKEAIAIACRSGSVEGPDDDDVEEGFLHNSTETLETAETSATSLEDIKAQYRSTVGSNHTPGIAAKKGNQNMPKGKERSGRCSSATSTTSSNAAVVCPSAVLERQESVRNSRPGAYAHAGIGGEEGGGEREIRSSGTTNTFATNNEAEAREVRVNVDQSIMPQQTESVAAVVDADAIDCDNISNTHRRSSDNSLLVAATLVEPDEPTQYAEPLDKAFLTDHRCSKRSLRLWVVAVLMSILVAVAVSVAVTREHSGSDTTTIIAPAGEDWIGQNATSRTAITELNTTLLDSLQYASVHVLEYGYTSIGCNRYDWSGISLQCRGAENDNTITVTVIDIASLFAIQCRQISRNHVRCTTEDRTMDKYSGSLTVACGSNVNTADGIPLTATLDASAFDDCNGQVSQSPTALGTETHGGDSYQWLMLGRFCHVDGKHDLDPDRLRLHSDYTCDEGSLLDFPNVDPQLDQQMPAFNYCVNHNGCRLGDNDDDQCNTEVDMVKASNPEGPTCVFEKPSARESIPLDRALMWDQYARLFFQYHDGNIRLPELMLPAYIDRLP